MSYLHYLCLFSSSLPPVVSRRLMTYLHYLCLFSSSLPPVVSRRDSCLIYIICVLVGGLILFTLFVFVQFVFTSSC